MNPETEIHAAREACRGKTFAVDPDAFKALEAAKVSRDKARDPQYIVKRYERWAAKQIERGNDWRARHWLAWWRPA